MEETSDQQNAVELLQQLGLKEYEARSFVALTRLPQGTAKELAELSEVPRTRIYESIRELESKGLVEIQHSNPQVFRAVPIDEAAATLRDEYESRTANLESALHGLTPARTEEENITHEVWGLSGANAIVNRTHQLMDGATEELILVIGDHSVITEDLFGRLHAANDRGVSIVVGTTEQDHLEKLEGQLPEAAVFRSELDWLAASPYPEDKTRISRLLLIDHNTILVSSIDSDTDTEQAVFGRGFDNGIVTIARRLLASGLGPTEDPEQPD